jgi:hypothetical protein
LVLPTFASSNPLVADTYVHGLVRTLTYTHRSGSLDFDETADIDIRGMDDDFQYCLEEGLSGDDEIVSNIGSSDEDSQSSDANKVYGYMGAGAGLLFAAAGFKIFSGIMGNAWRDDDDDLGAVLTKAVDADDMRPYTSLGSDAYNASMKSTSNSFRTAGTPVIPPVPPAVKTRA